MTTQNRKADLLREKMEVDDRLNRFKIKLQRARNMAAKRRIFMDPHEYAKLETKIIDLKRESQFLQLEIANLPKEYQPRIDTYFVSAARRLLPPETFNQILSVASAERETSK